MGRTINDLGQYTEVPISIQSAGDTVYDEITAIGLAYNQQYYLWVLADEAVTAETDEVTLTTTTDEKSLLDAFATTVDETFHKQDTLFVGYGLEQWGGGDFASLRTRLLRNSLPWVLDGYSYSDFGEAMDHKGRFNTQVPSMDGAYVATMDAFIDYYDLPVSKSLNKGPKAEALKEIGYTTEQIREFAEATDTDVPYAPADGLDGVYTVLSDTDLNPLLDEVLPARFSTNDRVRDSLRCTVQTAEIHSVAETYTSREDWHSTTL